MFPRPGWSFPASFQAHLQQQKLHPRVLARISRMMLRPPYRSQSPNCYNALHNRHFPPFTERRKTPPTPLFGVGRCTAGSTKTVSSTNRAGGIVFHRNGRVVGVCRCVTCLGVFLLLAHFFSFSSFVFLAPRLRVAHAASRTKEACTDDDDGHEVISPVLLFPHGRGDGRNGVAKILFHNLTPTPTHPHQRGSFHRVGRCGEGLSSSVGTCVSV